MQRPLQWVPEGFQVIDGGPTHLPRTFFTPTSAPPHKNKAYYIAIVEPSQHPEEELFWRQQVRIFIEQHLQRIIEDMQPCLYGVCVVLLQDLLWLIMAVSTARG